MKVWHKGGPLLDKRIESFTAGRDPELDQLLVRWDCLASIAHAKMLSAVGVLSGAEFKRLRKALLGIIRQDEKGAFRIRVEDEDVHSKVENALTKKLGDLGKKLHTGRSRNDQVIADLRLYSKDRLLAAEELVVKTARELALFAKRNEFVPMPGYTHMQRAMPSSVGLWAGAFAESILDDLQLLKTAYRLNDQNPLGSAAGYGISIKIDRALTTRLLGFGKIQNNALYVQNSRGKIESIILFSLAQAMLDLNRLATDLVLFNTKEFGFVSLPREFCTGSSIMPQKLNPDVLELVRAKSSVMLSFLNSAMGIINNLPSGYNRDLQLTKASLLDGFRLSLETLEIMSIVVPKIGINRKALENACNAELFAADNALRLVKQGVPFRDAYRIIAESSFSGNFDVAGNIRGKTNIGSTGNLSLQKLLASIEKESWLVRKETAFFQAAMKKLEKMN